MSVLYLRDDTGMVTPERRHRFDDARGYDDAQVAVASLKRAGELGADPPQRHQKNARIDWIDWIEETYTCKRPTRVLYI